jgi:hypothetical protein
MMDSLSMTRKVTDLQAVYSSKVVHNMVKRFLESIIFCHVAPRRPDSLAAIPIAKVSPVK